MSRSGRRQKESLQRLKLLLLFAEYPVSVWIRKDMAESLSPSRGIFPMRLSRNPSVLLLLCCWWPGLQGCAPALHEDLSGEPCPIPGGVADPAEKSAYVMAEDGGIDALDLRTGKLLWQTYTASVPLGIYDHKLLAQTVVEGKRNEVKIVVLDPRHEGAVLSTSEAVTFPDWVNTGLVHGRSFSSRGRMEEGNLFLYWEAGAWPGTGYARHTLEGEEAAHRTVSGVAKVSLENARVEMLCQDITKVFERENNRKETSSEGEAPPEFGRKLPKELQKLSEIPKLQGSPYVWGWYEQPLIVGDKAAVLAERKDGIRTKLILIRWDLKSGRELEDIELLPNVRHASRIVMRPNGLHVFIVHQETDVKWLKGTGKGGPTATEVPTGAPPALWILSSETGKVVGKVPMQENVFDVQLVGNRVYFGIEESKAVTKRDYDEKPRFLRAIDLGSGERLWERAILPARHLHPRS
jgi:hypothetical protein